MSPPHHELPPRVIISPRVSPPELPPRVTASRLSPRRNKECPTCRKKLVSKRSLRPDPNFDALISKIYPSRDEYEAHQDRVLAKLSRLHNQQALSSSIEEGLKMQAMHRWDPGLGHRGGPLRRVGGGRAGGIRSLGVSGSMSRWRLVVLLRGPYWDQYGSVSS